MSDDSFFGMDLPDIQGLIQQLDLFEEKQNEAVRNGLHKVGENMRRAQKRRISGVKGGQKLADAISVSKIYTTKKRCARHYVRVSGRRFQSGQRGV